MKNILLILFVLGFANLSQAQTKVETMDWLNNYAAKITCCKSNGNSHMEITVSENGDMTVLIPNAGKFVFNLADVQIDHVNPFLDGDKYVASIRLTGSKRPMLISGDVEKEFPFVMMFSADLDALKRVIAATMHLAKEFGAREIPNENTF